MENVFAIIYVNESLLKMMKNVFLFHVKSSFYSSDIYSFVLAFCLCRKTAESTLMEIWELANIFVFKWKYVEDFTLKHLLRFEICAREMWKVC